MNYPLSTNIRICVYIQHIIAAVILKHKVKNIVFVIYISLSCHTKCGHLRNNSSSAQRFQLTKQVHDYDVT